MAKRRPTPPTNDNPPATPELENLDTDDDEDLPEAVEPDGTEEADPSNVVDKSADPTQKPAAKKKTSKEKPVRQGDQQRPHCPQCSTPDKIVLLEAASTRSLFTWYACPNDTCTHRVKVPRPDINTVMGRRRKNQPDDFSAR